ncbi:MAG: hypothetical protein AAF389_14430 [Gemmatimonadota bacterium]
MACPTTCRGRGDQRRPGGRHVRPGLLAALVLTVGAAFPSGSAAQIAWDTPRLVGPNSPGGLGLYWLRAGTLPGDNDALLGRWTLPSTGHSVALQGGFGQGVAEEDAAFGGIDLRAPIARHTDTQPLDIEWTGGLGVGIGLGDTGYILGSVPVAISAGRAWSSGAVWFSPYVSFGGVFEYRHGDDAPEEEFAFDSIVGVGLDLAFDEGRNFVLSASAALGDRQAIAVGLVLGGG